VDEGEALFGPDIAARLITFFTSSQTSQPTQAFPELTTRENEVLDLIAKGLNNQAIATRLSISEKTVRNHISNIFNKLQVVDRAQAIVRAREAGMGR
jgi:DNA-binding NarL/FixJ family response regulator